MIDWSVRFGDLLVIVSLAGTIIVYAFKSGRFAQSMENMQQEIKALQEVAKSLTAVLITMAEQKKDIQHLRQEITELRHGKGYVHPS